MREEGLYAAGSMVGGVLPTDVGGVLRLPFRVGAFPENAGVKKNKKNRQNRRRRKTKTPAQNGKDAGAEMRRSYWWPLCSTLENKTSQHVIGLA